MKNKRLLAPVGSIFVALVLATLSLMAACAAPTPTPTPTPTPPPPFKVGNIYYQTGPCAQIGKCQFACAALAAKEINERGGILGGRMIEIHQYDEGYSAEESLASVKKAVADGCELIVGYNDSTTALPAQAYCREKGIVLTTTGAGTKLLTEGSYPGYFRSGFMCRASDRARARWVEAMGYKTVVYLAPDSKYCIDALEDYRSIWDEPDSPVKLLKVIWIPYGAADCKLEATAAASYNPDFIFGNTWGDLMVSQGKTLQEIGYKGSWTVCYSFMLDYVVRALGDAGNGSWHCFNWMYDSSVPESKRFWEAFKKEYPDPDMEPTGFPESAYEGMWITLLAVDAAGGVGDLLKYDQCLKAVDWMTPRGVKAYILDNRELCQPNWLNAELMDGKWINITPMPVLEEDFYWPPKK